MSACIQGLGLGFTYIECISQLFNKRCTMCCQEGNAAFLRFADRDNLRLHSMTSHR